MSMARNWMFNYPCLSEHGDETKLQSFNLKEILRLQLHGGAIYRPDSFVLMLRYCANLKAIRYESTSLNRIVADKSHRVIAALSYNDTMRFIGYDSIQTR